jgi:malate/lactate dehydrogenase
MAESILYDKKEVMTASFYLKGEYGIKDSILSVPLKLGRKGVEGVIELDLNSSEKDALVKAAAKVNQTLTSI